MTNWRNNPSVMEKFRAIRLDDTMSDELELAALLDLAVAASGSPPSPTVCRKCGFDPSRLHCPNCGAVVTVEREHFRTAPCLGSDGPVPHWSCD